MTLLAQLIPIVCVSACGVMTLTVLQIRLAILVGEHRTELDALKVDAKSSKQSVNAILTAHAAQLADMRRNGYLSEFSDN